MGQPAFVAVELLRAEVDHHQRHAVAGEVIIAVIAVTQATGLAGYHVQVGPGYVGVGDNVIGGMDRAVAQADSLSALVLDDDLLHFGVVVESAAQFLSELHECIDQRSRASHHVVDAPLALQVVDHGVDR